MALSINRTPETTFAQLDNKFYGAKNQSAILELNTKTGQLYATEKPGRFAAFLDKFQSAKGAAEQLTQRSERRQAAVSAVVASIRLEYPPDVAAAILKNATSALLDEGINLKESGMTAKSFDIISESILRTQNDLAVAEVKAHVSGHVEQFLQSRPEFNGSAGAFPATSSPQDFKDALVSRTMEITRGMTGSMGGLDFLKGKTVQNTVSLAFAELKAEDQARQDWISRLSVPGDPPGFAEAVLDQMMEVGVNLGQKPGNLDLSGAESRTLGQVVDVFRLKNSVTQLMNSPGAPENAVDKMSRGAELGRGVAELMKSASPATWEVFDSTANPLREGVHLSIDLDNANSMLESMAGEVERSEVDLAVRGMSSALNEKYGREDSSHGVTGGGGTLSGPVNALRHSVAAGKENLFSELEGLRHAALRDFGADKHIERFVLFLSNWEPKLASE